MAALTGLLFAVSPQVEKYLYRDLIQVTPAATTVPLADQIRAAQRGVGAESFTRVRPASAPGSTTRVEFRIEGEQKYRTAFINPHTGQLLGVQITYSEWLAIRTWLETFHSSLWLGDIGSYYSELAASWLWVIALAGVMLWLSRSRKRHRIRDVLVPRKRKLSWHAVLGVWALVGILAVSATGLTWSTYAGKNVSDLRTAMSWREPKLQRELPSASNLNETQKLAAFDRVFATASAAGLDGPLDISPSKDGTAWRVSQIKTTWPMKQDAIAVDPATGAIVDRVNFDDWPLMAKLSTWGIWLHMGILFGLVNQVALILLTVSILVMIILAYRMWWQRRPARGLAGPPTRARPSVRASAVVVALAVGVGIFLPVMGLSLILFLVGDVVRSGLGRPAQPRENRR